MKVSIGILAWNEAASIAASIQSLLEQSLFDRLRKRGDLFEIVCVPNGCTDQTATIARSTFGGDSRLEGHWSVHELEQGGKSNAWNYAVHAAMATDADVVFFMDADIRFLSADTLWNMLQVLEQDAHVLAVTDTPRKDIEFKETQSLAEKISVATSRMTQAAPGQLTGQLYGIRGEIVRKITIPQGIIADDGFIKHMICTDGYGSPPDNSRIKRADGAEHVFEAYTGLGDLFQNQVRQALAQTIYSWFRELMMPQVSADCSALDLVEKYNAENPRWFVEHINERVEQSGWWLMQRSALVHRFTRLRHLPFKKRVLMFPLACAGFALDLVVYVAANRRLKSRQLKGVWKDTQSTRIR